LAGFPFRDGTGPLPDSRLEVLADVVLIVFVAGLFSFFTGLDAQVSFAASNPQTYFFGSGDVDSEKVVLDQDEVDLLNSASKNRIGTGVGDEIGFCGGIQESGDVFDLRLAEGLETSRDSVRFSCVKPRNFAVHTQPGGISGLSVEDKSFDGEFMPDVSCILFEELAVSPVNNRVGGLSCWSVSEDGSFSEIPVLSG